MAKKHNEYAEVVHGGMAQTFETREIHCGRENGEAYGGELCEFPTHSLPQFGDGFKWRCRMLHSHPNNEQRRDISMTDNARSLLCDWSDYHDYPLNCSHCDDHRAQQHWARVNSVRLVSYNE